MKASNITTNAIYEILKNEIIKCIKELLEKKHLYQSIKINDKKFYDAIKKEKFTKNSYPAFVLPGTSVSKRSMNDFKKEQLQSQVTIVLNSYWRFITEANQDPCECITINKNNHYLNLLLPSIKITCKKCSNKIWPHNSGYSGIAHNLPELNFQISTPQTHSKIVQILFLPFQCQSCKSEPIIFMIRREDLKITLVGRSHFEEVYIPSYIPKQEQNYYSDAVISYNCGRTLAGLFYLRTMIEQYMRRVLNESGKISGDDLADRYSKLLDDEFPQKFTSLKVIYEELSIKVHQANNDEKQFNKSKDEILKHFELLRLLPLKKLK